MAFWGIEVNPGHPYTYFSKNATRRLHVSRATLGKGSGMGKSVVQCYVGDNDPVYLCALLPGNAESCQLDLEFKEVDDVVFSVIGSRSVHLTGYYLTSHAQAAGGDDVSESYGEDIGNSENDQSGRRNDDYDYKDSFINDDADSKDQRISISSDEYLVVSKPKKNKKRLRKQFQPNEAIGIDISQQIQPDNRRNRALVVDTDDDDDDVLPLSFRIKEVSRENNIKLPAKREHQEDNFTASDGKETNVNLYQQMKKTGSVF